MSLSKLENLHLLQLPDCVSLLENGKCSRLNITHCTGGACSLKLTRTEQASEKQQSMERLRSLDDQTQEKIARKYYDGKRVWFEEPSIGFRAGRSLKRGNLYV